MFSTLILIILSTLAWLIVTHLLFVPALNVIGLLRGKKAFYTKTNDVIDFGIVVTAYKDIEVCETLVEASKAIRHMPHYIYIVADQVSISNIFDGINNVKVIYPEMPLNSKVKSIQMGIGAYIRPHNYTVVLDPDNVITEDTLQKMTIAIQAGYEAVQAKRVAKNLDTTAAKLDALGEAFYNWCREIYFRLGGFVTLAGSGMAIKTSLFNKILSDSRLQPRDGEVIAGEDKVFQTILCEDEVAVAFVNDALVLDEKIGDFKKMQRQRTRWLKANFDSKPLALKLLMRGMLGLDMQKILLGYEEVKLPNSFLFLSSFMIAAVCLFIDYTLSIIIMLSLMIFIANFFISARLAGVSSSVFSAVAAFPQLMMAQIGALINMKKAKKDFLVTEKRKINI